MIKVCASLVGAARNDSELLVMSLGVCGNNLPADDLQAMEVNDVKQRSRGKRTEIEPRHSQVQRSGRGGTSKGT